MPKVKVKILEPREWQTLDEIIAGNVRRLREDKKDWTITQLARALGVRRPVVYDMEGARNDRSQREFKWSDLVALCGVLETTLFELVLPPEGVKVAGAHPRMIPEGDIEAWPFRSFGRDGLSGHLFGVGVEMLSPEVLEQFAAHAKALRTKRNDLVQVLASQYLKEIEATVEDHLRIPATETNEEE